MPTPDTGYITSVLAAAEAPCVSIYLPHEPGPNGQDHARFKGLVREAEDALGRAHAGQAAQGVIERLHKFLDTPTFWSGLKGSVVVLASPQRFDTFVLPRAVPVRVEVGDTFHLKPLLRFVQSADPFHVLGVSRERVALFRGNRYDLRPLEVPGVPLTLTAALGEETDESARTFHTAGPSTPGGGGGAMISHGIGARKDEVLTDTHRFFRVVDREVIARVSEPSGLPLIPIGIDGNLAELRAVSKNRFLTAEGVTGDWTKLGLPEIREKAWKVFEKHYLARLAQIREDFGTAAAHGKGTADLAEAARAAADGRIGVLLIDDDKTVPGALDMATGTLHPAANATGAGDMLDDLAEMALKVKATVIVTPSAQMPTKTGLAAIYRY